VIGMDVAASEFYNDKDKTYDLNFKEEVITCLTTKCFFVPA
jgi:enolase